MGRPKKDLGFAATASIEAAFWRLLETEPYARITVQRLADAAGVNRNALYYHYANVDDVAKKAFTNFLKTDATRQFASLLLNFIRHGQRVDIGPEFTQEVKKLQLCACSDSLYLNQMLKNALKDTWFGILHIQEDKLTAAEALSVEFIVSGIVALLGSKATAEDPRLMLTLPETDIGKAALQSLLKLAEDMANR